jgi:pyruvate,orthophosphate dikinase
MGLLWHGKAEGGIAHARPAWRQGRQLAEMAISPAGAAGFTISTRSAPTSWPRQAYPKELRARAEAALGQSRQFTGRRSGDRDNPLLRPGAFGARASMPGMMDTVPISASTT